LSLPPAASEAVFINEDVVKKRNENIWKCAFKI
jgi:hypothetical protein